MHVALDIQLALTSVSPKSLIIVSQTSGYVEHSSVHASSIQPSGAAERVAVIDGHNGLEQPYRIFRPRHTAIKHLMK